MPVTLGCTLAKYPELHSLRCPPPPLSIAGGWGGGLLCQPASNSVLHFEAAACCSTAFVAHPLYILWQDGHFLSVLFFRKRFDTWAHVVACMRAVCPE